MSLIPNLTSYPNRSACNINFSNLYNNPAIKTRGGFQDQVDHIANRDNSGERLAYLLGVGLRAVAERIVMGIPSFLPVAGAVKVPLFLDAATALPNDLTLGPATPGYAFFKPEIHGAFSQYRKEEVDVLIKEIVQESVENGQKFILFSDSQHTSRSSEMVRLTLLDMGSKSELVVAFDGMLVGGELDKIQGSLGASNKGTVFGLEKNEPYSVLNLLVNRLQIAKNGHDFNSLKTVFLEFMQLLDNDLFKKGYATLTKSMPQHPQAIPFVNKLADLVAMSHSPTKIGIELAKWIYKKPNNLEAYTNFLKAYISVNSEGYSKKEMRLISGFLNNPDDGQLQDRIRNKILLDRRHVNWGKRLEILAERFPDKPIVLFYGRAHHEFIMQKVEEIENRFHTQDL